MRRLIASFLALTCASALSVVWNRLLVTPVHYVYFDLLRVNPIHYTGSYAYAQALVDPRTSWVSAAIVSLLVVVPPAAVAALLTTFFLRSRGVCGDPRCRKCGYTLRGLSEPRCPECGEAI